MANYNVKVTGTKTTGTSIIGDWSDANCYNASTFPGISDAAGDTLVFDTGTYLISTTRIYNLGLSLLARGNGPVTIGLSAPASYVLQPSGGSSQTFIINNIDIDISLATVAGINWGNRGAPYNILCDGLGSVGNGVSFMLLGIRQGSVAFDNLRVNGTFSGATIITGLNLGLTSDTTVTFNNPAMGCFSDRAGPSTLFALTKDAGSTSNVDVSFTNIQGSHDVRPGGALATVFTIDILNSDTANIDGGNINCYSDSTNGSAGIRVRGGNNTTLQTKNPVTKNVTVNAEFYAGTAIDIGTDDTVGFVTNPQTHDNVVIGGITPPNASVTPHGIVHRGMSDGDLYKNTASRFHTPFMLSTCNNKAARAYSNFAYDCYGPCLSAKGNSDGLFVNNTVVITPLSFTTVTQGTKGIFAREQGATVNTNVDYNNNNILVFGYSGSRQFAHTGIDALDEATFSNNNFYSDTALPSDAWDYKGSAYGTLAAWNVAEGNNATDKDNFTSTAAQFLAANGNADATPKPTTTGGGVKVTGNGPRIEGFDNEPFSDAEIDQGYIQSTHSPNHPKNL